MFQFLFGELLDSVSCLNPRIFQLPGLIRNSFENVATHPLTGDFIDTREIEFMNFNVPSQIKDSNPTIKRNQQLGDSDQLLNAYCYQCSRSNLKLQQTSLLSSYSVHQPSNGLKLQSPNSELIKCDFCPLYWHLDCLNPPLTSIPPQLRENEIEIVNLRSINSIKSKIWGKEAIESGTGMLNNSRSFVEGLFSIRKKWMCPCHIQNVGNLQPKGWRWCTVYEDPNLENNSELDDIYLFSKSSRNNGRIEIINEKETDKLFDEFNLSKRKSKFDSIDRYEINGVKHRVPERLIKLDFLSKSCDDTMESRRKYRFSPNGEVEFDQKMLETMFPGCDTKYNVVTPVNSIDSLLEAAKIISSDNRYINVKLIHS